jgi:hypothetical protein
LRNHLQLIAYRYTHPPGAMIQSQNTH